MAYFLGIKKENQFIPLKIKDKSGNINNSILDLVDFTSQFSNDDDLLECLQQEGLIEDCQGEFYYLIDKGQKGNKTYNVVPGTNGIIFDYDKKYFSPANVRRKLHNRKYDIDFISHLYAFYLRKLGIFHQTVNYLSSLTRYPNDLNQVLNILCRYQLSSSAIEYINELRKYIKIAEDKGTYFFLSSTDGSKFESLLKDAEKRLSNTDSDIISISRALSSKSKNANISIINYLANIYSLSLKSQTQRLHHEEENDLEYNINQFIDFSIYNYDKKTSSFRTINGKRKLQERNLFDLSIFIKDYEEYEIYISSQYITPVEQGEEYDDEHEEFLEEEDFARINTTSEEAGFKLRKRDIDKYHE